MTRAEFLEPLAACRTDEVVVTTMGVTRPWGRLSHHDLDFASADSAMGHAADLALGIALARPERRVICLNGDGSMLMTLGTLVTAAGAGAGNYVLAVVDNGAYEITGRQPLPGGGSVDFPGLARAAGFRSVHTFHDGAAWAAAAPGVIRAPGPVFIHAVVAPGSEGPISRSPREEAAYLQVSLAEWSRRLRAALAAGSAGPL